MFKIILQKAMPLLTLLGFCLLISCFSPQAVVQSNSGGGTARLKIAATTDTPFQKIAKMAVLNISASDMLTLTKSLAITDSSVGWKEPII